MPFCGVWSESLGLNSLGPTEHPVLRFYCTSFLSSYQKRQKQLQKCTKSGFSPSKTAFLSVSALLKALYVAHLFEFWTCACISFGSIDLLNHIHSL